MNKVNLSIWEVETGISGVQGHPPWLHSEFETSCHKQNKTISAYMCVYLYVCVYMYMCVCMWTCMYECMCICGTMYMCMNVCVLLCMCACVGVCASLCICACVGVCVLLYMCVYICVYMCINVYMYIICECVCKCVLWYICYMYMCQCIYVGCTHTHTPVCWCFHTQWLSPPVAWADFDWGLGPTKCWIYFSPLASFIFPPNYHCPSPLLQLSKQRHGPVTVLPQESHRNKSQRGLHTIAMGPDFIRKLKVSLSLEQEVLPVATGTGLHAQELPVWAGMGAAPRTAGYTSAVPRVHTLLQILRARNRTDRTFQKRELPTGMCKVSFGEAIWNQRSDCLQPGVIPGCTVRSFHFLRGEWFLLIEF